MINSDSRQLLLAICLTLGIAGCQSFLSPRINGSAAQVKIQLGTLKSQALSSTCSPALDVAQSAVILKGSDNTLYSANPSCPTCFTVPPGQNYTVKVQGRTSGGANIPGAVLYAAFDARSGDNSVAVNWSSTGVGRVIYELAALDPAKAAGVSRTALASRLSGIHGSLVKGGAIAAAIAADTVDPNNPAHTLDQTLYRHAPVTITVPLTNLQAGQTLTLCADDPASAPITYTIPSGMSSTSLTLSVSPLAAQEGATSWSVTALLGTRPPASGLISDTSAANTIGAIAIPLAGLTVADPILWLKGDAGVTLDGSSKVEFWASQAGSLTAGQTTGTSRPGVVSNFANDLPGITLNGSQYLTVPGTGSLNFGNELSIFTVFKAAALSSYAFFSHYAGSYGFEFGFGYPDSTKLNSYLAGAWRPDSSGATITANQAMIGSLIKDASGQRYYLNGVSGLAEATASVLAPNVPIHIGRASDGFSRSFNGQIAEILLYNRAVTASEAAAIHGYLSGRWGITMPLAIKQFSPVSVAVGSSNQTLTLEGSGFDAGAKVYLDGTELVTSVSNSAQLTATLPAALLTTQGEKSITVTNPPAAGGATSNSQNLLVNSSTVQSLLTDGSLDLWLRADAGVRTLGSNIYDWLDGGPDSRTAVATAGSSRPTLVTNFANGLPAAGFSGSQYLTVPGSNSLAFGNDLSVFTVFKATALSSYAFISHYAGVYGFEFGFGYPDSSRLTSYLSGNWRTDASGATITANQTTIGTLIKDASGQRYYLNGVAGQTETTATVLAPNVPIYIGSSSGGGGRGFNGQIAEVLVYDRAMTTSEAAAIHGYLSDRWGVTMPLAVDSFTPVSIATGSSEQALTIEGSGFATGAKAYLDGTELSTSVSNLTQLTATVPASLLATQGKKAITVVNPPEAGGATSNVQNLLIASSELQSLLTESNLKLWLRSDAGLRVVGGRVNDWLDASPDARTALAASGNSRPTITTNFANGLPAASFAGSQYLTVPGTSSLSFGNELSIFTVFKAANLSSYAFVSHYHPSFGTGFEFGFGIPYTAKLTTYLTGAWRADQFGSSVIANQTMTGSLIKDASGQTFYLDGSAGTPVSTGSISSPGVLMHVGRASDGSSRSFNGQIAEILIYGRALTVSERQAVEAYLSDRWH